MRLGMIWAQARGGVIGDGQGMPWHVPEDLAHFKAVTMGHPVIMGHSTWRSIPARFRPFPGRENIVLSRSTDLTLEGAHVVQSLPAALELAARMHELTWVVGGGTIYEQAMHSADLLEVTELDIEAEAHVRAPIIGPEWTAVTTDPATGYHRSVKEIDYRWVSYRRVRPVTLET